MLHFFSSFPPPPRVHFRFDPEKKRLGGGKVGGGGGGGKRSEKHREPPHSSFTFETLPLESFDGLANGTFIPRSLVIVDRMKLSANFSITFFSPPFFLPEIHRLSDQIEHILRVFILLTCNNSSFVSRTDDSIERVKKKREKMEKSRRMRHASCAISSNLFPLRMPRITSRNAILCFVLPIVSFFFFFIGGNWHGARRPINCARETR